MKGLRILLMLIKMLMMTKIEMIDILLLLRWQDKEVCINKGHLYQLSETSKKMKKQE